MMMADKVMRMRGGCGRRRWWHRGGGGSIAVWVMLSASLLEMTLQRGSLPQCVAIVVFGAAVRYEGGRVGAQQGRKIDV